MRTLTLILLGLVIIFVAAIIAAPKLENKSVMISKEPTTRFEVKTKKTNRETPAEKEEFVVSFGVNASFEPQTEK